MVSLGYVSYLSCEAISTRSASLVFFFLKYSVFLIQGRRFYSISAYMRMSLRLVRQATAFFRFNACC